jgi:nitroreductase
MDWNDVVRRRRMFRDFTDQPVDREVLLRMLNDARRVPTAGFSQGIDFVVLEGVDTEMFWSHTLPVEERAAFRWPGLIAAPVIVLPIADAQSYLDRYSQPDKAHAGLGSDQDAWPVPYWFIDSGMAAMSLLYGIVNEGLGALFFGIFRNETQLLSTLGVPAGHRPIGAIAIGHPTVDARNRKVEASPATRKRRDLADVVHFGSW